MRVVWMSMVGLGLLAGAAAPGARADEEAVRPPHGEIDCGRFFDEGPARRGPFRDKSRSPSLSVDHARLLARCLCGFRSDVLWLREDMARAARAGEEQRLREQRVAGLLSDVGRLVQQTSQEKGDAERAALVVELGQLIGDLEKELGVGEGQPRAGAAGAPLSQSTELAAMKSPQESQRQEAGLMINRAVLDLVRRVGAPPAEGKPAQASLGWQVIVPGKAMQHLKKSGARALDRSEWDNYLLDAHEAYDELKKWAVRVDKQDKPDLSEKMLGSDDVCAGKERNLKAEIELRREGLAGDLHDLMEARGLRRPMTGILLQALGLTHSTGDSKSAVDQAAQVAAVRFESRHWSPGDWKWFDLGILGHFSVQPTFNMILPEPSVRSTTTTTTVTTTLSNGTVQKVTEEEGKSRRTCLTPKDGKETCDAPLTPAWTPQFEPAITWSLGARAGFNLSRMVEVSAFGRLGQALTRPKVATVEAKDDQPAAGLLLDSRSGSSRVIEYGGRFCLFNERGGGHGHHDLGILRPLLDVELGFREDRRFRDRFTEEEEIDRFGEHPERRHFVRVALSGLRVFGGAKDFEMSLGVEHEWRRGSKGLPEGTKVFIQGRLDLFGLISTKKADK